MAKSSSGTERYPGWLLEMDPFLREAETNALFQAFETRRRNHRAGRLPPIGATIGSSTLGKYILMFVGGALFIIALLTLLIALNVFACFALLIFILMGFTTRALYAKKNKNERTLPYYVHKVFSANGYSKQSAIDLWLAGANGRAIAEAIFLEKWEGKWLSIMGVLGGLIVIIITAVLIFIRPLPLASLLFFGTLIWCAWEAYFILLSLGIFSTVRKEIELRTSIWKSTNTTRELLEYEINYGCGMVALCVGLTIAALFLAFVLTALSPFIHYLPGSEESESFLAWAILLAGIAAVMRIVKNSYFQSALRNRQSYFNAAEPAFERFMMHAVMGDTDGRA